MSIQFKTTTSQKTKYEHSVCSSIHLEDDVENHMSEIKKEIISSLALEKLNKKIKEKQKAIHFVRESTGNLKNNIWMLFFKRLFKELIDKNNEKLTELNEIIFRLNYICNQNNDNLFSYSIIPNYNPIETLRDLNENINDQKESISVSSSPVGKRNSTHNYSKSPSKSIKSPNIILKQAITLKNLPLSNRASSNKKKIECKLSNYYLKKYDQSKMKILQKEENNSLDDNNELVYLRVLNDYKPMIKNNKRCKF